ncbi:MAG: hypothetical protein V2A34_08180 [Lentisphaerota bacterium]
MNTINRHSIKILWLELRRAGCALLLAATAGGLLCGCGSTGPKNVAVTMDKAWLYRSETLPSVEVDIIGVSAEEEHLWETYSMTAYWSPGDRLRSDAHKIVMRFGDGLPISQTLGANNSIWRAWRRNGAVTLFILADLPGAYSDQSGDTDPRRKILPLKKTAPNVEIIIRPYK